MDNYTILDTLAIIKCLFVWFTVSTVQGYGIGCLTNILSFRSRSLLRQLGLSALLSMAVLPVFYGLIGTYFGSNQITHFALATLFASSFIILCSIHRILRALRYFRLDLAANRVFLIVTFIWIFIALFVLVDIQIGQNLYLSLAMYDHGTKVATGDAIARSGFPPNNPYYYPGHAVPFNYHYYWALLCMVVSNIYGSAYDTRIAVLSGVIWTGIVFLCVLDLAARFFTGAQNSSSQSVLFSFGLLAVSNLYILIALPVNFYRQLLMGKSAYSAISWWTFVHIDPLIEVMIWVPHHVAALSIGLLASILISQEEHYRTIKQRVCLILIAGIALASDFGLSVYVCIGFCVAWGVWILFNCKENQYRKALITVSAGLIAGLLILPYLHELSHAATRSGGLCISVGKFELLDWFIPSINHAPKFLHQLAYIFCLPLRYFFGMGFYLIGAIIYWQTASKEKLRNSDKVLLTIALTSFALASFVQSADKASGFEWRVIMPAQFACLIWSAQYLAQRWNRMQSLRLPRFQIGLCLLGIACSIYALYLDRTSLIQLLDAGRVYKLRSLYSSLANALPLQSVTQHNPNNQGLPVNIITLLYSHRQVCCSEDTKGVPNCPDEREYRRVTSDLRRLFSTATTADAIDICHRYRIDVVVIDDGDKLWFDQSAWTQQFPVIAENSRARAYLIK
jgi:hypothetical protein